MNTKEAAKLRKIALIINTRDPGYFRVLKRQWKRISARDRRQLRTLINLTLKTPEKDINFAAITLVKAMNVMARSDSSKKVDVRPWYRNNRK